MELATAFAIRVFPQPGSVEQDAFRRAQLIVGENMRVQEWGSTASRTCSISR